MSQLHTRFQEGDQLVQHLHQSRRKLLIGIPLEGQVLFFVGKYGKGFWKFEAIYVAEPQRSFHL